MERGTGDGEKFHAQNPAEGEKGDVFTEANSKQVYMAVTGAAKAFEIVCKKDMKSRLYVLIL
ncbi:hypothetical protein [Autumnicola psychrophila]|uniref:Uncharacterized protein n=1 Tax=Autumnicola psychrophila TaxID=3075592 RepID=A0ABU3DMQ7_9FLAO|nr:hypothetical protein [Zunongwangia sp. F225]MDT0685001.1 hypothetical protein [Zunongwangia sp. F225]